MAAEGGGSMQLATQSSIFEKSSCSICASRFRLWAAFSCSQNAKRWLWLCLFSSFLVFSKFFLVVISAISSLKTKILSKLYKFSRKLEKIGEIYLTKQPLCVRFKLEVSGFEKTFYHNLKRYHIQFFLSYLKPTCQERVFF